MAESFPREMIKAAVLRWESVSVHPDRFNGLEFRVGRRVRGHLHGDALLDIPFPVRIRKEMVDAGRARPHHVLPESGWTSFHIRTSGDVPAAIELLRLAYDLAMVQKRPGLRR